MKESAWENDVDKRRGLRDVYRANMREDVLDWSLKQ